MHGNLLDLLLVLSDDEHIEISVTSDLLLPRDFFHHSHVLLTRLGRCVVSKRKYQSELKFNFRQTDFSSMRNYFN
jgi:hypothetical protein